MDRWDEVELFIEVVERQGLGKAGEALGMSKAAATRHLASLEERLGTRLIERNSRRLHITEAGRQFYERCRVLHAELREAEQAINASSLRPTGVLTITASLSFAMLHLAPLVPSYRERYPEVTVNIVVANRYMDLIDNGIDLAIRTREVEPDSSITVRRLAATRRVLVATPGYLAEHGTPRNVDDLSRHALLQYSLSNRPDELHFTKDGMQRVLKIQPLMQANDGQVLRAAALKGLGILVQPKYIVYDDLVAGRFLPVLDDHELPALTINLAYPSRKYLAAKCRSFVDFIVEHFEAAGHERKWMG
jgi:DNA-binding transcriptional LysR family regulator